jgi:hypothetical protein
MLKRKLDTNTVLFVLDHGQAEIMEQRVIAKQCLLRRTR